VVVTADAPVEVGLLGPLLVRRAGAAVAPGGPKPRGVLAVLALRAGQAVGLAELTDALWGPDAPPAATSSLRAHVSRLRAVIDPDRVGTLTAVGSGYRLALPPHALDVTRFGDLVRGGRAALDSGDARRAEALLTEGLALWRGPALADLLELPFAAPEAEQLRVHPGREWFTVLSGTVRLQLGERTILVQTGDAAEFSTMVPHTIGAHGGPVEILTIFDHDGERPPARVGRRPGHSESGAGEEETSSAARC